MFFLKNRLYSYFQKEYWTIQKQKVAFISSKENICESFLYTFDFKARSVIQSASLGYFGLLNLQVTIHN